MSERTDFFDDVYSKYIGLKPDGWFAPVEDYERISGEVGQLAQEAYDSVLHLKFVLAGICDKELRRAKDNGEKWAENWRAYR